MRQVFLVYSSDLNFENEDAFPMSERLLPQLESRFQLSLSEDKTSCLITVAEAKKFLEEFYGQYELSQPQRRIRKRLEALLDQVGFEKRAEFVVVDVSSHRDRRQAKKIQSVC